MVARHILQKHQKQNNSWIRRSMNPMMTLNCHFNHQSVKNNVLFAEHRLVVFWNVIENSIQLGLSIGPICQSLTPGSENMMMMEMKRLILGI